MKLDSINTYRNIELAPSWGLVYEWEDEFARALNLKFKPDTKTFLKIERQILKVRAQSLYHALVPQQNLSLRFIMTVTTKRLCTISKNTIPIIIDFWLKAEELPDFYKAYKQAPLILINSAEVYHFLKSHHCPLNIEHWPLSFPDRHKITSETKFDKKWDLVMIGRSNPYFTKMLEIYCASHPDFEYVSGSSDIKNRQFVTNKGNDAGHAIGRDAYFNMIKSAKIAFYSTPGCDEAKKGANGFNQVTPRFFELLSGGCHIIAHYTKNPDTDFYELPSICENTTSYTVFEKQMDAFRVADKPDMKFYADYLQKHYTTTRAELLKNILVKNNIVW